MDYLSPREYDEDLIFVVDQYGKIIEKFTSGNKAIKYRDDLKEKHNKWYSLARIGIRFYLEKDETTPPSTPLFKFTKLKILNERVLTMASTTLPPELPVNYSTSPNGYTIDLAVVLDETGIVWEKFHNRHDAIKYRDALKEIHNKWFSVAFVQFRFNIERDETSPNVSPLFRLVQVEKRDSGAL